MEDEFDYDGHRVIQRREELEEPVVRKTSSVSEMASKLRTLLKPAGTVSMPEEVRAAFRAMGQKGGQRRAERLSPEERSAIARKAGRASARKRGL